MIIKHPESGDISRLRWLWQEAFGDNDAFLDGFFSTGYDPQRCITVQIQDRPVAVLYWFDCDLENQKLAYIYAVATDKAYRGRGLCRDLMNHTHRHLQSLGYSAAVLVPGNEKLFSMYEKLGYRSFCPMEHRVIAPGTAVAAEPITAEGYFARRTDFLPDGGIRQNSAAPYLATFTDFYSGENWIACLSREGNTLYFQEFLGDQGKLPGLIRALGANSGELWLPGSKNRAMYYPLTEIDLTHAYLGLSLG